MSTIITAAVSILGGGAIVNYFKDRKKDTATANLTDMQTLQSKLTYLEQVAVFQKNHIADLHREIEAERESKNKMRARVSELEEEVDKLKRSAADTQAKCVELSERLKEFMDTDLTP